MVAVGIVSFPEPPDEDLCVVETKAGLSLSLRVRGPGQL